MTNKPDDKQQILSDHKKVGGRFIPPFLQATNFQFMSWVDCTLAELIWLGLLVHTYELEMGTALAVSLAKAADETNEDQAKRWFAPASAYSLLSPVQQTQIIETIERSGDLQALKEGLAPLVVLYPECPLSFIYQNQLPALDGLHKQESIDEFKTFLEGFFNKYEKSATLAQANALYIAGVTDMLRIVDGVTAFDNFPEIASFPDTEESRRIAAALYSSIGCFMSFFLEEYFPGKKYTEWSKYFWNRGLQLERCTLKEVAELYE